MKGFKQLLAAYLTSHATSDCIGKLMFKRTVMLVAIFLFSHSAFAEQLLCRYPQPSNYLHIVIKSESKKASLTMVYKGKVRQGSIVGIGEQNHLNKYQIVFPSTNPEFIGKNEMQMVMIDWGTGKHRIHAAIMDKVDGAWRLVEVERESFVTCVKQ
jgi:hypothetical protein